MLANTTQWIIVIAVGLISGWMLPGILKEAVIMPYGKSIVSTLVGAFLGAFAYSVRKAVTTNGWVFLFSLIGALICYLLVRAITRPKEDKNRL